MTDDLAAELAALAGRLSTAQVRAWREVLGCAPSSGVAVEAALVDVQVGHGTTGAVEQLVSAWRRAGQLRRTRRYRSRPRA